MQNTWTIEGLCRKISSGKSRNITSRRKAHAFCTRCVLDEQRDLQVDDKTCLSVPVRECHGNPAKLKHWIFVFSLTFVAWGGGGEIDEDV